MTKKRMITVSLPTEYAQTWLSLLPAGVNPACNPILLEQKPSSSRTSIQSPILLDVIPDDAEALFATAEATHTLDQLYKQLFLLMTRASSEANTAYFTFPFRLDRIEDELWQERLGKIVSWLSKLLAAPLPQDFTLLLPINFPKPYPTSSQQRRAEALCSALNAAPKESWDPAYGSSMPSTVKSSVKLFAVIHPDDEVARGVRITPASFKDSPLLPYLGVLSFTYNVMAGETLFDDELQAWAQFLQENNLDIPIHFTPVACPESRIPEILNDIAEWSHFFTPHSQC